MAVGTMTKTTRENIAACAAHGFYFWSDHPKPAHLWATDEHQRWHEIRISRKHGKAEHVCAKYGDWTGSCTGDWTARPYTTPDDAAGAALLLGLTDQPSPIEEIKTALRKHATVEELIGELQEIADRRRPPAVVASLITHDPTWMVPFSDTELHSALGMTRHDDAIRAELDRRREAS